LIAVICSFISKIQEKQNNHMINTPTSIPVLHF
jgi:hypothetical protein